jgi:hypothetical protein
VLGRSSTPFAVITFVRAVSLGLPAYAVPQLWLTFWLVQRRH